MVLSQISAKVTIFFSFAFASEDEGLFEKLRTHLSALKRQGLIDEWYNSTVSPGSNFQQIIESYVRRADIIVLLISADFFASTQCFEVEMKCALEQHTTKATPVIPVLLRPTDWSGFSLEQYQPLPLDGKPVTIWGNIDLALFEVAKGIRKVVEEVAQRLSGAQRRARSPQFPLYLVPDTLTTFFTDREDVLMALHKGFTLGQTLQTRTQALSGLGGIGKTFLAMKYASRYQHEYQAVLWFNARSRERLSADILSLADQLGLFLPHDSNEQQCLDAVRLWLQHQGRWLVILDDLDDFSLCTQLIPRESKGHVLLITHSQATGPFASAVPLTQMSIEEGALLLLRRAKLIAEQAPREAALETDYQHALALAQEVEGYPLAIDQAGAYIEETQRSLASYLHFYRQRQATFLGMRGRLVNDHPDPVTTTLSLTFEQVAHVNPNALELLSLLAFLHADAIPDEMIMQGASTLDDPLRMLAADLVAFDRALATLQRFSLVHRRADTTTVTLHRIVQGVLVARLTKEQQYQMATQVVRLVASSFPEANFKNWATCERYLPHAQRCDTLLTDYQLTLDEAAPLLQRLGSYCYKRALYPQAETYLGHALRLREQLLGPEHADTAQTVNALALLYNDQGNYRQAEQWYQRALTIRERAFGSNHFQTAQSLNNLGYLSYVLGDYARAEQLLQRALNIYEQALSLSSSQMAFTLNNLALVYQKQGKSQQVEPLFQRALTIRERVLDPEDPQIAQSLNVLGVWYQEQGRRQQAEEMLLRALDLRERSVGSQHPDTALSLDTLAGFYETLDDYQRAEAFYQRALAIYEQVRGPVHPDTGRVLNNLAFLLQKQGQYERAEVLYLRTLSIYEQMLGSEHPRTANVLYNLGHLFWMQGNARRAEPLLRRALAIREQSLGLEHLDTVRNVDLLAELLTAQGHYEQAEPLFLRALATLQQVLGSEHSSVALIGAHYRVLLERMNRTEEAATFQQKARSLREQESPLQGNEDAR